MEEELDNLKDKVLKLEKQQTVRADMVSVSAHQIRTFLSGIKWILKMFTSGDLGKLTTEQKNLMEKAYESNDRAINLVSELLLANKADNIVEKEYSFSKFDMAELVEDSIFDLSGEAHANEVEVIFLKPDDPLSLIYADKDKMRIVLQNLIENAIKYSNKNGKIFVSVVEKDKILEVSVKDSGIGISEEGKNKVFEKFYRDTNAQKKQSVGSGIGLYTAKTIIEKHNGKIWLNSAENEGTTFFFTVPISPQDK